MASVSDIVQPKAAKPSVEVTPKPGAEPAKATKTARKGFSDELLQIPALQALFAGSPPAVSTPIKEFANRPEAKIIEDHKDDLQRAGVGLYRSMAGDIGVLFNQLHIAGQDLVEADKQGRLLEVAPPFDQVNQSVSESGEANPVLNASVPQGPKTAGVPAIPASPTPASVQNKQLTARLKNMQPGAPTSGPLPGAGRIMNNILKPVV